MKRRVHQVLPSNTNYEAFTSGPIKFLKYVGITITLKRSLGVRIYHTLSVINGLILLFMQMAYIGLGCGTLWDRYAAIIFVNYFLGAFGKHFSMLHSRLALRSVLEDFKNISPSMRQVQQYGLESYLRNYKLIERFISNFFIYIALLYSIQPIIQTFVQLWLHGEIDYQMLLPVWPEVHDNLIYAVHIVSAIWGTALIGFSIVSSDVSLLSCLSQLCAHFDMLAQRIMDLKPEKEESLENLNEIIREHQRILGLVRKVNEIFAPSIGFTLAASSFIICFVAYQMLDDVSFVEVLKAFILLCYESKQVVLICYYGDKLTEMSSGVFDAIYMHDWYKGSLKYRRQVLFLLTTTQRPVTIRVIANIDVSLITLKQVFSNSYIFAVLKTA